MAGTQSLSRSSVSLSFGNSSGASPAAGRLSRGREPPYRRSEEERNISARMWLDTFLFLSTNCALMLPSTPAAERMATKLSSEIARVSFGSRPSISGCRSASLLLTSLCGRSVSLTLFSPPPRSLCLSLSPLFLFALHSLSLCELLYLSGGKGVMLLQRCISILPLLRLNI